MQTQYEKIKSSGVKSTWYSPDGFSKIEEFDNGMRFQLHPCFERPIQLPPKPINADEKQK